MHSDIFSTYNKGYRSHVSITHSGGFLIVLHQFQNHISLIDDKMSATFAPNHSSSRQPFFMSPITAALSFVTITTISGLIALSITSNVFPDSSASHTLLIATMCPDSPFSLFLFCFRNLLLGTRGYRSQFHRHLYRWIPYRLSGAIQDIVGSVSSSIAPCSWLTSTYCPTLWHLQISPLGRPLNNAPTLWGKFR